MRHPSLFFFVGENTYQLSKEVSRWKKSFRDKHGDENFAEYEGSTLRATDLLDAVSVMPFISEKRLVHVRGVPKIEREELASILNAVHPQTLLLITDSKPDKRLGVTKDLEKAATIKSFPLPSRPELLSWMQSRAGECGATLTDAAASELVDIAGEDQWILENEIQKLVLFAGCKPIDADMVDLLCVPSGTQVIWKLTDLVGSGKCTEALAFLRRRLDRGEDPYGMWVILLNMIKNLVLVIAALESGARDERSISSATGLHPFAARGLMTLAKKWTKADIRTFVEWASSMDIALKTGGIRYSVEHQIEVTALVERAILFCGKA